MVSFRLAQKKLHYFCLGALLALIVIHIINWIVLVKVLSSESESSETHALESSKTATVLTTTTTTTKNNNTINTTTSPPATNVIITTNSTTAEEPPQLEIEVEFPYPKQCQMEYTPNYRDMFGDVQIHVVYHVGMLNNWKRVVMDQLQTLTICGLGYMASSLTISYSGDDVDELKHIVELFPFITQLKQIGQLVYLPASTRAPWEGEAMSYISQKCHNSSNNNNNNSVVYYFHNKGVSKYEDDGWINDCQPKKTIWSYCNVLHWRKYLEFFILEKPTLCLTAMLHHGASTCGIDLHEFPSWHYSGNFWSATCSYVRTLPTSVLPTEPNNKFNYVDAELWIGNSIISSPDPQKHVSFMDCYDLFDGVGLYRNVILPHQYSNLTQHLHSKYSHIWHDYMRTLNGSSTAPVVLSNNRKTKD